MPTYRIDTNALLARSGSIEIETEEEIELSCPQCGTKVAPEGQCIAEFRFVHTDKSKTGVLLGLFVDCRNCGQMELPPAIEVTP